MTAAVKPASARAVSLPSSAIREIMALAAARTDVIHLEVGEPDFGTPQVGISYAAKALEDGWTRYTMNAGLPSLRKAIATRVGTKSACPCEPERVVVTVGAVGALYTSIMAITDAGDEILIPDPGWPNYAGIVHMAGATAVAYTLASETDYRPDFAEIEAAITSKTKAIVLNTPANPTGAVFSPSDMRQFATLALRHRVYLISDEIYEDSVFEGEHTSALGLGADDNVLLVSGFSKSFAMTGWRLGYVVCPPHVTSIAAKLQECTVSCAPTVSQKAGEAALAYAMDNVEENRSVFRRRRDILVESLVGTGLLAATPKGAFYALVKIPERFDNAFDFCKRLLLDEGVATVPGGTFGASAARYVRLAFTTDDDRLRVGLARLVSFSSRNV